MENFYEIIKKPLITEKTFDLIERENKLVFIVNRLANKNQIKRAFEKIHNVKVIGINTLITSKGEKKALKKARNIKDIHEEGKRLGAIGHIYFKAGNFKNAIKSHKEALEIFKKTGEKKLQIEELESLGNAYLAQGVEEK